MKYLRVTCDECHGTGGERFDDDDYGPCAYCGGRGDISAMLAARDAMYRIVGVRIDMLKEWFRFTRMGTRYWRKHGKEHKARRLAAGKTELELAAIHGHRLNRLRQFADFIEHDGMDAGRFYRIESRLVAEAARAIEIKRGEHGGLGSDIRRA